MFFTSYPHRYPQDEDRAYIVDHVRNAPISRTINQIDPIEPHGAHRATHSSCGNRLAAAGATLVVSDTMRADGLTYRPIGRLRWYCAHGLLGSAIGLTFGVVQSLMAAPWLIGLAVVLVATVIARRARRSMALVRQITEARALLDQGRLQSADQHLQDLAAKTRFQPVLHSLVVFTLGSCRFWQGHVADGITLMEAGRRTGWLARRCSSIYARMLGTLACALAVSGNLERADRVLRDATRCEPEPETALLPAKATVLCRAGRIDQAAGLIEQDWHRAFGELASPQLGLLAVLRAFCRTTAERPRAELSVVAGHVPAEVDLVSICADWEELRHFVARLHQPNLSGRLLD